jgi:hypothetical protein
VANSTKVNPWLTLGAGWLVPGLGYFLQGHPIRAMLTGASTILMFLLGLMLQGAFFVRVDTPDTLTNLIYLGGVASHWLTGLPWFLATWMGYNAPDVAGHSVDYGSKFLVGAGLLNILSFIDAWEIAKGKKS